MYRGFPLSALSLLRCPRDGKALSARFDKMDFVQSGSVTCIECKRNYPIADGIVRLLDPAELDEESRGNLAVFDKTSAAESFEHENSTGSLMEMAPTLQAVAPFKAMTALEYGCGNGRYTTQLAPGAALLVALDFSIAALRNVAGRADPSWNIALVQADCLRPITAPGSFDRILCTLTSNLPTKVARIELFQAAARTMKPDGRFVFSAHYYSLRDRLRGTPRSGYYQGHHIFRYLSGKRELTEETSCAFGSVRSSLILVTLPFARRLGLATVRASRWLERIPIINWLGEMLLITAEKPEIK